MHHALLWKPLSMAPRDGTRVLLRHRLRSTDTPTYVVAYVKLPDLWISAWDADTIDSAKEHPEHWAYTDLPPVPGILQAPAARAPAFDPAPRTPMTHVVKSWPELFQAWVDGRKTHDLRRHDLDYREGDTLRLREYDPSTFRYTGREHEARITYVTAADRPCALSDNGLQPGYCILSIAPIEVEKDPEPCPLQPHIDDLTQIGLDMWSVSTAAETLRMGERIRNVIRRMRRAQENRQ